MPPMPDAIRAATRVHDFTDFARYAACIMTTKGYGEAARRAQEMGWSRVSEALTKATVAGTTVGATAITTLLSAFLASVRNVGVTDTIAANAMKVPDRFTGRVGVFSSVAASSVNEGSAKPLRYLSLTMTDFTPVKATAQIVMTNETILALGDEGIRTLGTELKNSVAAGSDAAFLSALSGNSGEAIGGSDDWAGINADLEELLRDLALGAGSKPFLIMTPAAAKDLAVRGLVNGVDSLRWNGGSYAGVEILVSDAQTPGRITAVDATGLVVLLGDFELRSSDQALIEMVDSSSQTSGASVNAVQAVSMWQTDSRCLLAERSIAVKGIRGTAWAHLTNVQLGVGFDSPMSG